MPTQPSPPFAVQHTPQVPELLNTLGITLVLSTYQAGKVVFLSAKDDNSLVQLPRTLDKPMGIAEDPATDRLAIACRREVMVFANSAELAHHYPKAPQRYDAMYLPRLTYHTGAIDVHDLNFGDEGRSLYAVNTKFSCLMTLDDRYSFVPYWQPKFISRLSSDDRCHLNGMAMEDGQPRYATSFSQTDTPGGWRPTVTKTGTIFDVPSGEVLATGLAMPHSPRLYDGELFVLLSATGELARVDRNSGKVEIVRRIGGFVRGLGRAGDYLFVGVSRLREKSSTFGHLEVAKENNFAGIKIIHLPTAALVGELRYLASVDEIYDVHVLSGKRRPNLLNTISDDHQAALSTPDTTYWGKLA